MIGFHILVFLFLGTATETCVGKECRTKWGGNITCMKPVTELVVSEHCTGDTDVLMHVNYPFCKGAAISRRCPTWYTDSHCACCKYPIYSPCSTDCKCKGTCAYFEDIGYTNLDWCNECSGSGVDLIATNTNIDSASTDLKSTLSNHVGTDFVDCDVCKFIKDCTGYNAPQQWDTCWRDYSYCCRCDSPNNYTAVCPDICKWEMSYDENTLYSYVINAKTIVAVSNAASCRLP
jgi:hypothetical protein